MRLSTAPSTPWLRAAEMGTWAATGIALFLGLDLMEARHPRLTLGWTVGFLVAGLALAWLSSTRALKAPRGRWGTALLLATGGGLAMIAFAPSYLAGFLLLFTAWHAAQRLPVVWAFLWVALQTAGLGVGFLPLCPHAQWHLSTAIYGGMQAFIVLLVHLLRFQEGSREELLRSNAELRATQELLTSQARMAERLHLAREIHDVMGHTLTALHLRLEVASRQEGEATRESLQGAKALAKELLAEVRHIVAANREDECLDLPGALRILVDTIARPVVHLDMDPGLRTKDPQKAQVILRCVQELVTNAMKHGDAEHLWIHLALVENRLVLEVKDDGRGAETVVEGFGLKGLRERLELLGGGLAFAGGQPGFRASLWLPAEG